MDAARSRRLKRIDHLINILSWRADRRQAACRDESIRGLRPAGVNWMTESELNRLDRLQVARVRCAETTTEIRVRVAAKREARLKGICCETTVRS